MNMKVAIYCRVSTDEQNIAQQRTLLVKYCQNKGYKFRSYIDNGISGKISERPSWQKLLADAQRGLFDIIIVTKIDRITRELKYAIEFYEWFINQNIKFISLWDNVDLNTPDGYFSFMLKCLLSEYELTQLKWRSRIGIERAKKEGKYKGGVKGRTWKQSK